MVWRNLGDLKNFKKTSGDGEAVSRKKKTETRTTVKGNCMSLDWKWLVCSGWRGGVEWCGDHPSTRRSSAGHWTDAVVVVVKQILEI